MFGAEFWSITIPTQYSSFCDAAHNVLATQFFALELLLDSGSGEYYLLFSIILAFAAIILFQRRTQLKLQSNIWQAQEAQTELKVKYNKAELKAAKVQFCPHFMFNMLTCAQYSILKNDTKEAVICMGELAGLMREVLEQSESNLHALEKEIIFLERYLTLDS
jgi:two-component system LytT family sensor kinase